ncbi:hypothetical protein SAMN05421766_102253 [Zobellia uliginosa]|uniref:Uncharacterized protein n=1 Tax=Zobellia uliginosa TaxID=143224 RepID=A0ABY1KM07_9FLAO|nr:hypothetical protein [Zobellia uliginosa]SIS48391.1 hypothetical protein SAMN05421766_102253 [Zobellia uliginosa]
MDALLDFLKAPFAAKVIKPLLWIIFISIAMGLLRKPLKKSIGDATIRYKALKGVELGGYFFIFFLVLLLFTVENIEDATLEPTLALKITDYKLRHATKHQLFERIQQSIFTTEGKVVLASTTLQLLKVPNINVQVKPQV